jgi:hypothetical protein
VGADWIALVNMKWISVNYRIARFLPVWGVIALCLDNKTTCSGGSKNGAGRFDSRKN